MQKWLFLIFLGPLSINAQCKVEKVVLTLETVVSDVFIFAIDGIGQFIEVGRDSAVQLAIVQCARAVLYPNPTADFIKIEGLDADDTEGSIYNASGQFLYVVKLHEDIEVSFLPQGVFLLRTKNRVFKFIKL
jgi:hypothetical protein